jgi:glutathione S-transferase
MTDSIVLHGDSRWESPYVFSSFVALREKGIPFELHTMSLHDDEHRRGECTPRAR